MNHIRSTKTTTLRPVALLLATLFATPTLASEQTATDDKMLPTVTVTATPETPATAVSVPPDYAGGQVARGARLGVMGNSDMMDTPFSVLAYTEQTVRNEQARSVVDVLAFDPAVRSAGARSNIGEDFTLRGFPVASQDVALNGMYGLMPYFRVPIEMAERVEVFHGPSALLNGMPPSGNIGGTINIVPKRAGEEPLNRVTLQYLSDSTFGAHADIGRRFGPDGAFGVRVNAMGRAGDSTVDYQGGSDRLLTLGLDYRGERLRLSADVMHQKQKIDGVVRQIQLGAGVTSMPAAPNGEISYPGGFGVSDMEDDSFVLRGEYDLSSALTAYAGVGERNSLMDAYTGNPMMTNNAGDYIYGPAWQVFGIDSRSMEAGIRSRFSTGPVAHELTVGATRVEQDSDIFFYFGFAPVAGNIYVSSNLPGPSLAGINPARNKFNEVELNSKVIADTLSFADDRVKLTLGLRDQEVAVQNYSFVTGAPTGPKYTKSATTPMAGIVVKPWQHVSFYASYIEGLSQGPTAPNDPTLTNPGEVFPPVESKQTEVGVKADWGKLGGTLALYELTKPSGIRVGNTYDASGEQTHKGIELNLFGELAPALRVLGGLSHIDSEMTKTAGGVNQGKAAVGVPELQLNAGLEWDAAFMPGTTFSARAIHTGKQYANTANTLTLPAWTRADIGVRYTTTAQGKPLVLRANVENLFDKAYWGTATAGYLYVGTKRTLQLSATMDF